MTAQERQMTPEGISIKTLDQAIAIIMERQKAVLEKDVMTAKEAAEYLRYSPSTFHGMVSKGIIKGHRPNNGDYRFLRSELLEFVKAS